MSVLSRDEFFNRINDYIGTNSDDAAIQLVEDLTDTYNDLEKRNTEENWEQRYKDLDASWRERYKKRFFSGDTAAIQGEYRMDDEETADAEDITIDELLEESEE